MGAAPLPGALGFVGTAGWRRARARLHFPAGIAQDRGHLGLASDTAAVTLGGDSALFLLPEPSRRLCSVADRCPQAVMSYFCSCSINSVPLVLSFPSP